MFLRRNVGRESFPTEKEQMLFNILVSTNIQYNLTLPRNL